MPADRKNLRLAAGAAAVVVGVAGWAYFSKDSTGTPPPPEFVGRTELPSCGETRADGPGSSYDEMFSSDVIDCLISGRADSGGEYKLVTWTTDGDPIVRYFRALPGTTDIEFFIDKSGDEYSDRGWTHAVCPAPEISVTALRECLRDY